MDKIETFISVDIETSGPIPGEFSLLSIGACLVYDPDVSFECLVKPVNRNADPEALKVTGLDLDVLTKNGEDPESAFRRFASWIEHVPSADNKAPIFVGFNAAFDWSFVNYYFHRYLGHNPFGFAALDIKSLYMGKMQSAWSETKSSVITKQLQPKLRGNHTALDDARFQAELFRLILKGRELP